MLSSVYNAKVTCSSDHAVVDLYSKSLVTYTHDDFRRQYEYLSDEEFADIEDYYDYLAEEQFRILYPEIYEEMLEQEEEFRSENDTYQSLYDIVKSGIPFFVDDDGVELPIEESDDEYFQKLYNDWQYVVAKSHMRTYKLAYDAIMYNKKSWVYFLTFTFDPKQVDRKNYRACADLLIKWLDKSKKDCRGLKYVIIPELHKDGAIHFHGLFSSHLRKLLKDSGHFQNGHRIFNVNNYGYGFTTASVISDNDKTCSYILKYLTKDICQFSYGFRKLWRSRNLMKPSVTTYQVDDDGIQKVNEYALANSCFVKRNKFKYWAYDNCLVTHYRIIIPPNRVDDYRCFLYDLCQFRKNNNEKETVKL